MGERDSERDARGYFGLLAEISGHHVLAAKKQRFMNNLSERETRKDAHIVDVYSAEDARSCVP